MEYNDDNIEKIAWLIVEDMSLKDLEMFVYEDIVYTMQKDKEVFNMNVEVYKEI